MKKKRSAYLSCLLCAALLLSALGVPTLAETPARQVGDKTAGFVVTQLSRLDLVNADVTLLEHEKTGAVVMLLENEDNNRAFDISFRTPVADDTGVPHVFEHATLNGSKKYPSKSLFFNLIYQPTTPS